MALTEITNLGNEDFIANNLFAVIYKKFDNVEFRNLIIDELSNSKNNSSYKIVLIDFLTERSNEYPDQLKKINNEFYNITKDRNLPDKIRSIAASKLGTTQDKNYNKQIVKEIIRNGDIAVINGAAKAVKRFVRSNSLANEIDEWVDLLIEVLENNKIKIKQLKGPIWTLGYTNSIRAREYLMELFAQYSRKDSNFSETIAYSLSNIADAKVLNLIFNEYYQNKDFNNFGSELTLSSIANQNSNLIEQLYSTKNDEYLLNYLHAIKYIKQPNYQDRFIRHCKESLKNESEEIRIEAIKAIHFLLPSEEEATIFSEHLNNEKSQKVKDEIYFFIGR